MLNRFIHSTSSQDLFINIDITTIEGICRRLKLSNNKDNIIEVNKNIIVYNDTAISLNDVIKLKISIENIDDYNIKNKLYKQLKNSILYKYRNTQIKNQGLSRMYNYKSDEYNIESHIQKNQNRIKKVSYNGITSENTQVEDILSSNSTVDIHKTNVIKDIGIDLKTCNVVNSIEHSSIDVVTDINIDKIEVLTDNAKEVEVAKPIKTNEIEVVRDLDMAQYDIIVNPKNTSAVKDIKKIFLKQ